MLVDVKYFNKFERIMCRFIIILNLFMHQEKINIILYK